MGQQQRCGRRQGRLLLHGELHDHPGVRLRPHRVCTGAWNTHFVSPGCCFRIHARVLHDVDRTHYCTSGSLENEREPGACRLPAGEAVFCPFKRALLDSFRSVFLFFFYDATRPSLPTSGCLGGGGTRIQSTLAATASWRTVCGASCTCTHSDRTWVKASDKRRLPDREYAVCALDLLPRQFIASHYSPPPTPLLPPPSFFPRSRRV